MKRIFLACFALMGITLCACTPAPSGTATVTTSPTVAASATSTQSAQSSPSTQPVQNAASVQPVQNATQKPKQPSKPTPSPTPDIAKIDEHILMLKVRIRQLDDDIEKINKKYQPLAKKLDDAASSEAENQEKGRLEGELVKLRKEQNSLKQRLEKKENELADLSKKKHP
jgi:predicted RNase H-like nuclease (RuvC/YqgF family)